MLYAIGIDIGTGSTKAVAITATGQTLASSQVHYAAKDQNITEQDPKEIWNAFSQCINEIIAKVKETPAVIGLSSYMHGVMAVDAQGKPLTNLITWADTRAEDIATELRQSADATTLYRKTGTPLHSMSPLCKIIRWKKNRPELMQQTARFISIKEYIWYKLFHEFKVDYSIASATGLMDIINLTWFDRSLRLCGITSAQLSALVPNTYIRNDANAQIALQLNIPANTKFCIGASDGCLANLGSGAIKKDIAALTIGTSGAVRLVSPTPVYNDKAMTFNYILDKELYVCGGPVNNGGNIIQWLLTKFLNRPLDDASYNYLFETIDKVPPGSKGLLFLPYLFGERAPLWDERSSGSYFGISDRHDTACFLRAAIEGICFALYQVLQLLEETTTPISRLNISGGLLHSKIWMQILADITGKNLCITATEDASAVGAAIMALKSAGHISSYDILENAEEQEIVPNGINHQLYQEMFGIFKDLYPNLQQPMHRLYELNH
jgi:gluconokinase